MHVCFSCHCHFRCELKRRRGIWCCWQRERAAECVKGELSTIESAAVGVEFGHVGFAEVQACYGVEMVWMRGEVFFVEFYGVGAWCVGMLHWLVLFTCYDVLVYLFQVWLVLDVEW